MALFSNRLRTITGEDTGFWKSLSRLFYYAANRKRIIKFASTFLPFINNKVSYNKWLNTSQIIDMEAMIEEEKNFIIKPKFCIIIFGTDVQLFQTTFTSIKNQSYSLHSTFAIENMTSINSDIEQIDLTKLNSTHFLKNEFVLFIDAGDILNENCLHFIARGINTSKNVRCIYFDEDKITSEGIRHSPDFKPAWSPDLFSNCNYIEHAFIHHSLLNVALADIKNAYEATNKLLYKNTFNRESIVHIDKVLLSVFDLNTINKTNIEPSQFEIQGEPLISIIIPTRNKAELVRQCLDSVIDNSSYKNYEIVLIDNRSDEESFQEVIQIFSLKPNLKFKVIQANIDFNFSALINLGVENSKGELIVLLNNDVQLITPNWIEQMASFAQQKHVGAVGTKLLYPDNTIQHAGIILDEKCISKHVFVGKEEYEMVNADAINTTRNYLAVTAACLMISRDKFYEVGGFDLGFEVEYNDIDFCLKLYEKGYYNVYIPSVKIYHYESASRRHPHSDRNSYKQHLAEVVLMQDRWKKYIDNDPFNVNRY